MSFSGESWTRAGLVDGCKRQDGIKHGNGDAQ